MITVLIILVIDIALGSFYNPDLLPNHRGENFKHVNAKVCPSVRHANTVTSCPFLSS